MDKKRIHEMLEKMTEWTLSEMESKGKEQIDTEEMGKVVDMVKDLADAEMNVWKKCYYEAIVKAMEEDKEKEELMFKMDGRMGYDRWRTSTGRFAPKGHGHETSMAVATGRAGFVDMPWHNPPYYDDPRFWDGQPWMAPMGYDESGRNGDGSMQNGSNRGNGQPGSTTGRMGYTPDTEANQGRQTHYDLYQKARRHFHETGDQEQKQQMKEHGKESVEEALLTVRDIFTEADPQLQQKMRDDLARLYREFGGK